jgi:hypothetical protein
VVGNVLVHVPSGDAWNGRERLTVVVSLAHTGEATTTTIEGTGRETARIFWLLNDDETLSAGETTQLQIRVRSEGETLARTTRTVTVENDSRTYDC